MAEHETEISGRNVNMSDSELFKGTEYLSESHRVNPAGVAARFVRWTPSVATPGSPAVEKDHEISVPFAARCAKWIMRNS